MKKNSCGGSLKGTCSEEKISKNVDFSLWGNHATTHLKLNFFRVLAHCVYSFENATNNSIVMENCILPGPCIKWFGADIGN